MVGGVEVVQDERGEMIVGTRAAIPSLQFIA
jgi:hypothetical protein